MIIYLYILYYIFVFQLSSIYSNISFFPSTVAKQPARPWPERGVRKPFDEMTSMEKRCYKRARGPPNAAGDPLKELSTPMVRGMNDQSAMWNKFSKIRTQPVTPTAEIPRKYSKMNYIH